MKKLAGVSVDGDNDLGRARTQKPRLEALLSKSCIHPARARPALEGPWQGLGAVGVACRVRRRPPHRTQQQDVWKEAWCCVSFAERKRHLQARSANTGVWRGERVQGQCVAVSVPLLRRAKKRL